ncbi:MAG TPA: L-seryl-tRNA(Sec) selenium transferase [Gemmataceae bacterium]|jgi:L-seryl-tRNA(Ser) seleniumtransferase|nr:L-seryl-tRNA(Sec) selenium transferase [Gemmataceae bacterium]
MTDSAFRALPSVHEVLLEPALEAVLVQCARPAVVAAVRDEIETLRTCLRQGSIPNGEGTASAIASRVERTLLHSRRPKLTPVINATGILLHTNLGRAPLAEAAAQAAHQAARGYLNLELSLDDGKRSSRQDSIRDWLCQLTGAASATAVNNNAAATILALHALAAGKEVILSRGQMIEIGGSFRIPEILTASAAILREVGTTNITRLADYEQAIGPATAAILRIHPSNYRIRGFTASVSLEELIELGRRHNLPVIDDVGSGALVDLSPFGLLEEPIVGHSVAAGADLVLASGDKLLGGPQAGIVVGRQDLIKKMELDPLMRAFRLDKMSLAALEATLRLYLSGESPLDTIPVLRMLTAKLPELESRALALANRLRGVAGLAGVDAEPSTAYAGGGAFPDQELASWQVRLMPAAQGDEAFARRLRLGTPAVLSRIRDGWVCFDLRTIFPEQEDEVVKAVEGAASLPR